MEHGYGVKARLPSPSAVDCSRVKFCLIRHLTMFSFSNKPNKVEIIKYLILHGCKGENVANI